MRSTKQSALILENMRSRFDHPTAEMVYLSVKKKMPTIGIATVYRQLDKLSESGKILKIKCDGADRFDGQIKPHLHFHCNACNLIYDIFLNENIMVNIEGKIRLAIEDHGATTENISCSVNGICKKCNLKNK